MVLRKQPPPRLDYSSKWHGRIEPRSQTSPTAKSASSASPKRLTRPRRAQSSPQPRRIPSVESIFSPDLNTSPAFDLMPLEQAQRSPVATSSSEPSNPWADELVEIPDQGHQGYPGPGSPQTHYGSHREYTDGKMENRVPPTIVAGTRRRMASNDWQSSPGVDDSSEWEHLGSSPVQLQSNNPFLKSRQPEQNPWGNSHLQPSHGAYGSRAASLTREDASDRTSQNEGYIPMTARLSLLDEPTPESPWADERPRSVMQPPEVPIDQQYVHDQASRTSQNPNSGQIPMEVYLADGQAYDGNPSVSATFQAPKPTFHDSQYDYPPHYDQNHLGHERLSPGDGIHTPSATTSSATTQSSHELIDFDDTPKQGAPNDTSRAASSVYDTDVNSQAASQGPLQNAPLDTAAPPVPQRTGIPGHSTEQRLSQPTPSVQNSEVDANRINDERSETYSIRHINWTDISGNLRESPVLVQSKNGPCPLLALVNALVLRASQDSQPPIVKALQTREHISLGLLIEAMFDELITCLGPDDDFPDIEALSKFLTMLHTGMNVNPRFTLESENAVGSFYQTSDIRLYGTFGVPLVHGWVAPPLTEAHAALVRVAQYHEDVQMLHFRKEELEDRVFRGGSLTPQEEQTMDDIQTIQRFVDIENATQLSTFGLDHLTKTLAPGSVSILFRNDHFSTLYKHPQTHKLYTLVTDAGYSSHAEVVWECLVDVNGTDAEFSAGDFRPVSHTPPGASDPAGPRGSSNRQTHDSAPSEQQNATLSPQEQADADYAYALSLQFQEEERENNGNNRTRNRPASTPHLPSGQPQGLRGDHNRSSSVMNSGGQFAGRRSSGPDEGPPPSYEQASTSPVYHTPQRTPADVSREHRHSRNVYGRRPLPSAVTAGLPDRPKDRNKDCVVM